MQRKRKFGLLVLILVMFLPAMAAAQGTVEFSEFKVQSTGTIVFIIDWTADGTGTGTATANFSQKKGLVERYTGFLIGQSCYYVTTTPGSALDIPPRNPPSAGYDVVISDENGLDIFGGQLIDRSAIIAENAAPEIGSVPVYGPITCVGDWSVTITNAGAGGQGTVKVLFR